MSTNVSRINITLPKDLAADFREIISPRERSKVIAEALKEKIARIKREESLKKLKGIWTKAGGIDFKSDKELTAWRRSLWASTNVRLNKKIRG